MSSRRSSSAVVVVDPLGPALVRRAGAGCGRSGGRSSRRRSGRRVDLAEERHAAARRRARTRRRPAAGPSARTAGGDVSARADERRHAEPGQLVARSAARSTGCSVRNVTSQPSASEVLDRPRARAASRARGRTRACGAGRRGRAAGRAGSRCRRPRAVEAVAVGRDASAVRSRRGRGRRSRPPAGRGSSQPLGGERPAVVGEGELEASRSARRGRGRRAAPAPGGEAGHGDVDRPGEAVALDAERRLQPVAGDGVGRERSGAPAAIRRRPATSPTRSPRVERRQQAGSQPSSGIAVAVDQHDVLARRDRPTTSAERGADAARRGPRRDRRRPAARRRRRRLGRATTTARHAVRRARDDSDDVEVGARRGQRRWPATTRSAASARAAPVHVHVQPSGAAGEHAVRGDAVRPRRRPIVAGLGVDDDDVDAGVEVRQRAATGPSGRKARRSDRARASVASSTVGSSPSRGAGRRRAPPADGRPSGPPRRAVEPVDRRAVGALGHDRRRAWSDGRPAPGRRRATSRPSTARRDASRRAPGGRRGGRRLDAGGRAGARAPRWGRPGSGARDAPVEVDERRLAVAEHEHLGVGDIDEPADLGAHAADHSGVGDVVGHGPRRRCRWRPGRQLGDGELEVVDAACRSSSDRRRQMPPVDGRLGQPLLELGDPPVALVHLVAGDADVDDPRSGPGRRRRRGVAPASPGSVDRRRPTACPAGRRRPSRLLRAAGRTARAVPGWTRACAARRRRSGRGADGGPGTATAAAARWPSSASSRRTRSGARPRRRGRLEPGVVVGDEAVGGGGRARPPCA